VWVAADAKEIRADVYSGNAYDDWPQEKLYAYGERLAWGYYTAQGGGTALQWKVEHASVESWDGLEKFSREAVQEINHGESFIGALFAGHMGGAAKLLGANPFNSVDWSGDYLSCGNGHVAAKAVWIATTRVRPKMSVRDRLVTAMASTIQAGTMMSLPVSLWSVPADGEITKELVDADDLPR
jgi:hypothetical protein